MYQIEVLFLNPQLAFPSQGKVTLVTFVSLRKQYNLYCVQVSMHEFLELQDVEIYIRQNANYIYGKLNKKRENH